MTKHLLDICRNLLIILSTGFVVFFLWKWNWIIAVILAVPAYVLMVNVFGFLTLPLYLLTPENRRMAKEWKALNRSMTADKEESTNE